MVIRKKKDQGSKKVTNSFIRELSRQIYGFEQDYLEFYHNEPISAVILPTIILLSLVYLLIFYLG